MVASGTRAGRYDLVLTLSNLLLSTERSGIDGSSQQDDEKAGCSLHNRKQFAIKAGKSKRQSKARDDKGVR